jgi:uncharacterized protein YlxP (DUF503 family)
VGDLDLHRFAEIGFALTGNESRYISSKVDHLLTFIEHMQVAEVVSSKIEVMAVSDLSETPDWEAGKYDEF